MAEIRLQYDARNKIAQKTIDYILSLGLFKIAKTPNSNTIKAIEDARKGKGTVVNNKKELDEFLKGL